MGKFLSNQKILCLMFLLLGGTISCFLQYEIVWDLVNYHYYNGWAFVNNRFNKDVLLAGLNGFFNPLPDVPLYFLIKYFNDSSLVIFFFQGLWFGALMFLIYKLELLYFDVSNWRGKFVAFVCFCIAITGNATFLQIGTSSNEIMLAFFYLLAFYLLIQEIFFQQTGKKFSFILSGFLLGAAMGLKLTGVIYCVVSGITLILFYKKIKNPFSNIFFFTLSGLIGFLLIDGFWMWKLWKEFQNPFYPFANNIFHSEWVTNTSFFDRNFIPQNWKEFLIWPFIMSFTLHREEGIDMFVTDFRGFIVYVIFICFCIKSLYLFCRYRKLNFDDKWFFLCVYTFVAYLIWACFFSISRYFVIGEILFAFIITKCLADKKPQSVLGQGFYYSLLIFVFFVLISTPYFSDVWGKKINWFKSNMFNNSFLGIEDVHIPDNALIKTYNYPTSAYFVSFAEKNPTIKGVNVFQQVFQLTYNGVYSQKDYFSQNEKWQSRRDEIISNHKGPVLLLIAHGLDNGILKLNFSKNKEVKGMRCHLLKNNLLFYISLCAPKEIADQVFLDNKFKIYEDDENEK